MKYSQLCNTGSNAYSTIVAKDGLELKNIPTDFMSDELCMTAVKQNGLAIKDVPEKFHSSSLLIEAVKQNPQALKYITQSQELCDNAVSGDGMVLEFVDEIWKTQELCETAVRKSPSSIKWARQSPYLCLLAVKLSSKEIVHVVDEFKTTEVCEAVVASPFVGAGKYLPIEFKNRFDNFYKENGYESFGPIKICMNMCIYTCPCKHYIILEDGSASVWSSREIANLLKEHGLSHPHFDQYLSKE